MSTVVRAYVLTDDEIKRLNVVADSAKSVASQHNKSGLISARSYELFVAQLRSFVRELDDSEQEGM